ncbi:hypothetical protein [Tenacibaculum ovolyticum]|uniref:hypothetical protein n=1 Tax=Tenacibaculum ovolyticum TaxID=104270 RepID=UPI001F267516|nr:hypothetical protein [Tenacibaculum ovolyticum]
MEATDEKVTFEIIEKVPKEKLQVPLKLYAESAAMESYVKLPFLLVGVLFLIHNVFIVGNSYSYSTYKNIKNIEISIIGIIVLAIFIMAGIAMNKNSKTKKALKEISKRYTIKTATVQEEFSALAIHMYGGRGVVLKK